MNNTNLSTSIEKVFNYILRNRSNVTSNLKYR